MSDVNRVCVDLDLYMIEEDPDGSHALIPWEDYERLRDLEDAIIVTVGGIDVNLLDVIKKHRATIEALSSRLSEVVE